MQNANRVCTMVSIDSTFVYVRGLLCAAFACSVKRANIYIFRSYTYISYLHEVHTLIWIETIIISLKSVYLRFANAK